MSKLLLLLVFPFLVLQCDDDTELECFECDIYYHVLNEEGEFELTQILINQCREDQIGIIRYSSDGNKRVDYTGREVDCE